MAEKGFKLFPVTDDRESTVSIVWRIRYVQHGRIHARTLFWIEECTGQLYCPREEINSAAVNPTQHTSTTNTINNAAQQTKHTNA